MDRRIVSRLLAPVAAMSLLLLVTAVASAWYARSTQRRVSGMLTNHVASVRAARELEGCVRGTDARLDRYAATGDRAHLGAIAPLRDRALAALRDAEELAYTPDEQVLMARVRAGCERLFAAHARLQGRPGPVPEAEARAASAIPEEILEPAAEYARLNEEMLARSGRANEALSGPLTAGFLVIGLCGAAGGLLGGWALATGVGRAIRRTEAVLRGTAVRLRAVVPAGAGAGDTVAWVDESVAAVLDRLRRMERDALRAEQLAWMGQMAAGIAHEVRNPLMAIKILVQTAAEPLRGAPFRARDLAVIEREIARLEHTVTGFLDFARPPLPAKQAVDLRALVDEVVAGLQARADRQRVAMSVASPPDPVTVLVDPGQFRQVVYNLLFNALDAQPGGGRVRVSAAPDPDPCPGGRALVLRVEDDGPGLPAGVGDRVFDPFVSTKDTGLGLGLSICRRIVEAHGGAIRAEGAARGAAFTVRLPLPPA